MMAKSVGTYLRKAFTLVLFMAISAITLFFAYGYRYDFKKQDIQKTSIIDLTAKEKDVTVYLEGKQVSTGLPYQIKGVLPGKYVVEVKKEGFDLWQRQVDVTEDIVTIVNDVLLVPREVGAMVKEVMEFSDPKVRFYPGADFLAVMSPGDRILKVISLFGDGTVKDEDIEMFKSGIDNIEPLTGENFLIYFDDGGTAWVNFADKRFVFFNLPEGVEGIKVNGDKGYIYYLLNGSLYGVSFSDVKKLEETPDDFMIVEKAGPYVTGMNGDIYFLSSSKLYRADHMGRNPVPVAEIDGDYVNIGSKRGRNHWALILRDAGDKRHLWLADRNGLLTPLEHELKGDVFFNAYDQLIYASDTGSTYFHDPLLSKKTVVSKQSGDFSILGWFTDEGHFIQREGDKIILNDIYNSNRYILVGDIKGAEAVFVPGEALYFLKGTTLFGLNWLDKD
jgi:hypothetical protein